MSISVNNAILDANSPTNLQLKQWIHSDAGAFEVTWVWDHGTVAHFALLVIQFGNSNYYHHISCAYFNFKVPPQALIKLPKTYIFPLKSHV